MGIENLHLVHLTNNAHFQLQTQLGNLIVETGAAALNIEPLYNTWHTNFRQEDTAIKKILKSPLTESMKAADHRRDVSYRAIAETNRAALNHFWAEARTAATRLQIVLDTYG
ncbi:MAG: DUF6261 family protein, partial [Bacteroidales bacterium]|nr:DUF6261 family protein [Bacteroidales bacterium]